MIHSRPLPIISPFIKNDVCAEATFLRTVPFQAGGARKSSGKSLLDICQKLNCGKRTFPYLEATFKI